MRMLVDELVEKLKGKGVKVGVIQYDTSSPVNKIKSKRRKKRYKKEKQ